MSRFVTFSKDVTYGNINGIPIELGNGDLIVSPRGSYDVRKSINGGETWSTVHTLDDHGLTRLNFLDSRGYIFIGTESGSGTTVSSIVRSTDNGASFVKVLTVESSASWYMVEKSNGDLYLSEYSTGPRGATEKYAYNVWKSVDSGATWSKFYSHSPQSTPGAQDSIRHIHLLAIDRDDQLYISFGETGWGVEGGSTYKLNANGSLGSLITTVGNGNISFMQADNGMCFFGTDQSPNSLYRFDPQTETIEEAVNISTEFGVLLGTDVFDCQKGKDGVLYALLRGASSPHFIPLYILVSADAGETWILAHITNETQTNYHGSHLTLNKNRENSRVYIGRGVAPYLSFPDYTQAQLRALYTSSLTIR